VKRIVKINKQEFLQKVKSSIDDEVARCHASCSYMNLEDYRAAIIEL
jgi:hypothetical protein